MSFDIPESIQEATDAIGEEKTFALITSQWLTNGSNAARADFRVHLKAYQAEHNALPEDGSEEYAAIVAKVTDKFEGWDPTVKLRRPVGKEDLKEYLKGFPTKEAAMAALEELLA